MNQILTGKLGSGEIVNEVMKWDPLSSITLISDMQTLERLLGSGSYQLQSNSREDGSEGALETHPPHNSITHYLLQDQVHSSILRSETPSEKRKKKKPVNVTFLFCIVCFPLALTQNPEQQRVLPGRAYWWNWTQLDQNRIQQMGRSHPPSSFVLCHGCMHSGYPGKFQHLKVLECTQSPLTSNPDSFWKQLALVDIFKTLLC